MTIDMSQFQQAFFEESIEGLDVMEAELLRIDRGEQDAETINVIFRAAHSIKGGAGTFGFPNISDYTHLMETLLDEMRNGQREITHLGIQVLLESADILRAMILAAQSHSDVDQGAVAAQQQKLQALLENRLDEDGGVAKTAAAKKVPAKKANGKKPTKKSTEKTEAEKASGGQPSPGCWHIHFKPQPHLLRTGNEPARIFRELGELGKLRVDVDSSAVPLFELLEPEDCYLGWDLHLEGDVEKSKIQEQFDWVLDDCELTIEAVQADETNGASMTEEEFEEEVEEDAKTKEILDLATLTPAVIDERRESSDRRDVEDRRSPLDRRTGKVANPEAASIRVSTDKIDALINMVGELVITQSMLSELGKDFTMERLERLQDGLGELAMNTRELQENIMRIRMLPISFAFNRLPRMVHDTGQKLGKKIELAIFGEQTELDKTVMEKIGDPMVHLARNAIDHGIETPAERRAKGKPETGTLTLNAFHQGGSIIIEISDDGAGLRCDKIRKKAIERGLLQEGDLFTKERISDLIFHPGLSTADQVSDVSGRGVGMDVVRQNIRSLGGSVEVASEVDKGTKFTIRLPLTLAILDGQLVKVGDQIFIVQLTSIVESLQVDLQYVGEVAGMTELYKLRNEYISVIRLHEILNVPTQVTNLSQGLLVVVEDQGRKVGLFVDDLLGQQQVVIKSLESNFQKIEGISGATILGDGKVSLILDVAGLIFLSRARSKGRDSRCASGSTIAA